MVNSIVAYIFLKTSVVVKWLLSFTAVVGAFICDCLAGMLLLPLLFLIQFYLNIIYGLIFFSILLGQFGILFGILFDMCSSDRWISGGIFLYVYKFLYWFQAFLCWLVGSLLAFSTFLSAPFNTLMASCSLVNLCMRSLVCRKASALLKKG